MQGRILRLRAAALRSGCFHNFEYIHFIPFRLIIPHSPGLAFLPRRAIIGAVEELLGSVRQYVCRYRLLTPAAAVTVGVSGGPDSLCLLHLLCRLAPELDLRLHVAHLHHGLRGADADADAAFVAELAADWRLPCVVGRADVAALAAAAGLSLEEAARQARYRFLAEVAASAGSAVVAVGHNADDQAETVLMHFLRGSGLGGLRGMTPVTPLTDSHIPPALPHLLLVRPLLATSRQEIIAYCAEHGLRPRFDRSNEDTTFFRNRLRHEVLPLLARCNPQIRDVLCHTAEVMAGDHEIVRLAVADAWAQVAIGETPIRFDLAHWRALPLGLQRATIREAIQRLRASLRNINWEHVEAAVWLAREGQTGQRATLAAGLELTIGYDALLIGDEGASWPGPAPQIGAAVRLNAPGSTRLGGWQVVVRQLAGAELPADYAANPDPWTAYLDAQAVGPAPMLRPRQPGDRFRPHGLGGHSARVNEFMINAKLPAAARSGWPLLVGANGIAWLCGLRVDERALVRPETHDIWQVQFIPNQPTN